MLVIASAQLRTLFDVSTARSGLAQAKFVAAECGNQHAASVRSPESQLQSALEKRVLESGLKRAGLGVADSKTWRDFELRGAMDLHICLATLFQRRAHCVQRERGRVTITAEMSEHSALNFSRQQFLDHACRGRVRQMTMPRLDSLFHRPRAMRVVLQKFFVVIGLDHERLHLAQAFNNQFGHVPKIGDEAEAARSGVKNEPQRIDGVVRHGECLHCNVANGKFGTGLKDPPISTSFQETAATERVSGESITIDRQIKFAAENFKSADMISVFVREENAVELLWDYAALLETQRQLPRAQPAIDENFAVIGCNQRAVPRAPAAEHGQAEHGS